MQGLMKEALSTDIGLLKETNSNILERSGKQLRPMIALLIARVTGAANIEKSVRYAAATELLHNATLLHDDVADHRRLYQNNPLQDGFSVRDRMRIVGEGRRCLRRADKRDQGVCRKSRNSLSDKG